MHLEVTQRQQLLIPSRSQARSVGWIPPPQRNQSCWHLDSGPLPATALRQWQLFKWSNLSYFIIVALENAQCYCKCCSGFTCRPFYVFFSFWYYNISTPVLPFFPPSITFLLGVLAGFLTFGIECSRIDYLADLGLCLKMLGSFCFHPARNQVAVL